MFTGVIRAEEHPAWEFGYAFRRLVTVSRNQAWHDADVASLAFRMGDLDSNREPGRILVTDTEGNPAPSKVLFAAPRRLCTVLFRAKPGRRYFVHFGPLGEDAETGPELEVKRGLVLETRKRPNGRCNSWRDMRYLLSDAREVFGAAPVPNVFLGHNPFGTSMGFLSVFKGFIRIPKTGTYTFCTVSADSSFVFIDGEEVVSWPGRHNPAQGLWGQIKGTIDLEAGLHEFAYYQESRGKMAIAELGWFLPGEKRPRLVPRGAFPGFLDAKAGGLQRRDGRAAADFDFKREGVARVGSAYLYAVGFRARVKGGSRCVWDFGDGLEAEGDSEAHVFVEEGTFRVRLTVSAKGKEGEPAEFVQNLDTSVLLPHWRAPRKPEYYIGLLQNYDFQAMGNRPLKGLLSVFQDYGTFRDMAKILAVLVTRTEKVSARDRLFYGLRLGEILLALGRPGEAREAFAGAGGLLPGSVWDRMASLGETRASFAGENISAEEALKIFTELAGKFEKSSPDLARRALNASGDVHLAKGDWREALAFYERGHGSRKPPEPPSRRLVRKGGYATEALGLIDKKKFEEARQKIRQWEEEYPEEKTEGYSADLRARSYLMEAKYAGTVEAADAFLRLKRVTHFTAPLLYLKGTALWGSGKMEEATAPLMEVVEKYPETPEKKKAERLIRRIRGDRK